MAFNWLIFYIKLRILRLATRLFAWLDRRRSPAISLSPNSQTFIPSTLSPHPGKFDLFFYHPPGYDAQTAKENKYPIVFVLHGGGWCVGHARHDERFIATLTARGFVVVAVNYRLAPEHPYPTPVADCLDAILYTWKHAPAMGLDRHHTFIAGFSVGSTMAFASLFMLWKLRQDKASRIDSDILGTVKGITAFYPPMDLTKSREERAASNSAFLSLKKKPMSSSKLVGSVFDQAYFWNLQPKPEKNEMCVSPGLARSEVMKEALPDRIFFKLAGLDPLLVEGQAVAARLKDLGKNVDCETIENVPHYWDHLAKTAQEKRIREEVYVKVADEIKYSLGLDSEMKV